MTDYLIANNISTQLSENLTSSQTSITLLSTVNFPTITPGQSIPLTLNDQATGNFFEVVYVTAITGGTLTVVRGQEGTAARAWLTGDFAYGAATAGFLDSLVSLSPISPQTGTVQISGNIESLGGFLCSSWTTPYSVPVEGVPDPGDLLVQESTSTGRIYMGGSVQTGVIDFGIAVTNCFTFSDGTLIAGANKAANYPYFYAGSSVNLMHYVGIGYIAVGTEGVAGAALSYGNAGSGAGSTDLGSMGNTISGTSVAGVTVQLNYNGNPVFGVSTGGNTGILGSLTQSSLLAHKINIAPISADALAIIEKTDWIEFNYEKEEGYELLHKHLGYGAENADTYLSGPDHQHGYEPGSVAALACRAIQQLSAQNKDMAARLKAAKVAGF